MDILPYAYALLVFTIVAFLFILLGRIFLNVHTTYEYNFHRVLKDDSDQFDDSIEKLLKEKGKDGWKFERIVEVRSIGHGITRHTIIFSKSRNKIKLFG